jgi:hypothetical protein
LENIWICGYENIWNCGEYLDMRRLKWRARRVKTNA